MDAKVKLSRLQLKNKQIIKAEISTNNAKPEPTNTTPVSRKNPSRLEEDEHLSPVYMRFTQDSGEDELDVIWDWELPRSKGNRNIHRKRLIYSSPKVPKRAAPPNNQFHSLKAVLEELENNSSDNKLVNIDDKEHVFDKPEIPILRPELLGLLDDDSFDEEMVRCSQQAEEALNETGNNHSKHKHETRNDFPTMDDDSFDVFLEDVCENKLLSQASSSCNSSQNGVTVSVYPLPLNSPRAITRFNSVPITNKNLKLLNNQFPRTKSEDFTTTSAKIKCSPDEIEKKRQEARLRLEKKKTKLEIERKRLEALERLKRNRLQRSKNNKV